jgi:hypothetical protein
VLQPVEEFPDLVTLVGVDAHIDIEVEDQVSAGSPVICLCSMYQEAVRWHERSHSPESHSGRARSSRESMALSISNGDTFTLKAAQKNERNILSSSLSSL